jgi:hypothetical protein
VEQQTPSFPCVVAEFQKNERESIRVSLVQYGGRDLIDCRVWYRAGDGELKPGNKGLTTAVKHLPAIAAGLAAAVDKAREIGWLEVAEEPKDKTAAERMRRYRSKRNAAVTHLRNGTLPL